MSVVKHPTRDMRDSQSMQGQASSVAFLILINVGGDPDSTCATTSPALGAKRVTFRDAVKNGTSNVPPEHVAHASYVYGLLIIFTMTPSSLPRQEAGGERQCSSAGGGRVQPRSPTHKAVQTAPPPHTQT